ncbi:MAG: aminomethyl-transferring glycine dehydrogenase subunit GcvPB [Candidatus Bathyarchaeota archaeon]|nr:MAG: aminomethyl-transferring glycine dehydrogenase subunit GcvPB [Candidatus Bathyarchaeota archaeon]
MSLRKFRQADWEEPLIFELGSEERVGFSVPSLEPELRDTVDDIVELVPNGMLRTRPPMLPEVSEIEVLRHFIHLSQMNYGVSSGLFYPLGSCTMKYSPVINEVLAGHPRLTGAHPDQDVSSVQGVLEFMHELKKGYLEVMGMDDASLQPAAGAHGEYLGILITRAYHADRGELDSRREIIIPDAAHGTNPASAMMAGFKTVEIPSDEDGGVDLAALKSIVGPQTAGLMLTNPNTLGIFDSNVAEIAEIVHGVGGLMYYDGANLNAIMGKCRPGDMGFDVVHVNLHKTFSTPHGGGGPGSGPVGVKAFLADYLPVPDVVEMEGVYSLSWDRPKTIGKIHGYHGNVGPMLRAFAYMLTLGGEGLKEASEISVLNSNYIASKLKDVRGYTLPFAEGKPRMHEAVLSALKMEEETGVRALNVSKKLLDYGLHAPTTYFPLIVPEALMIEPTETEPLEALDMFIEAMKEISDLAYTNPEEVLGAPHDTTLSKLDEARAAHPKTICLSWRTYCQLYR